MTIKEFSKFSDRALYAFCVVYNLIVFGLVSLAFLEEEEPQLERIQRMICEQRPFTCLLSVGEDAFLIGFFTFFSLFLASKNSVWKWFFILIPFVYAWLRWLYNACYPITNI